MHAQSMHQTADADPAGSLHDTRRASGASGGSHTHKGGVVPHLLNHITNLVSQMGQVGIQMRHLLHSRHKMVEAAQRD